MDVSVVEKTPPNQVIAIFDARAVLFDLSPAATFEDLSERLAQIVERHGDTLVSVDVRICQAVTIARLNGLVPAGASGP
jgi:hypothetical protein